MSRYAEMVWEQEAEAEAAEHAAWLASPEGRAWEREQDQRGRAAERVRAEQERRWQMARPLEWAAWLRLQPVLLPRFGVEYDFPEFLTEVGEAPDGAEVVRVNPDGPFQAGNLRWSAGTPAAPSPAVTQEYLSLRQVAVMTGMSYDFVYDAARSGELVAQQVGRQWRVKPADARAWMEAGRNTAPRVSRPDLRSKVNRYFPPAKG